MPAPVCIPRSASHSSRALLPQHLAGQPSCCIRGFRPSSRHCWWSLTGWPHRGTAQRAPRHRSQVPHSRPAEINIIYNFIIYIYFALLLVPLLQPLRVAVIKYYSSSSAHSQLAKHLHLPQSRVADCAGLKESAFRLCSAERERPARKQCTEDTLELSALHASRPSAASCVLIIGHSCKLFVDAIILTIYILRGRGRRAWATCGRRRGEPIMLPIMLCAVLEKGIYLPITIQLCLSKKVYTCLLLFNYAYRKRYIPAYYYSIMLIEKGIYLPITIQLCLSKYS